MTARLQLSPTPVVALVEGDPAVTHAITFAFGLEGLSVRSHPAGEALLADGAAAGAGCIVANAQLPDMTGLELLGRLRARGVRTPAILIATHPGPVLRQRAEAAGAAIVEMPLLNDALLDSVRSALATV